MPEVNVKFYYYNNIIPIVGHMGMGVVVDTHKSNYQVWHRKSNLSNAPYTKIEFTINIKTSNIDEELRQIWESDHSILFHNCAHKTLQSLAALGTLKKPTTRPFLLPRTAALTACYSALSVIENQRLEILEKLQQQNTSVSFEDLIIKEIELVEMHLTKQKCCYIPTGVRKKQRGLKLLQKLKATDCDTSQFPVKLTDAITNPSINSTTINHLSKILEYIPRKDKNYANIILAINQLEKKAKELKLQNNLDPNIKIAQELAQSLKEKTINYFLDPTTKLTTDTYIQECQKLLDDSNLSKFHFGEILRYIAIAIARAVASPTTLRRFTLFQSQNLPFRTLQSDIRKQIQINAVPIQASTPVPE